MSQLNPLNDLSRVYLDHVAKMNQQNESDDIKRWQEGENDLQKQIRISSGIIASGGAPTMEEEKKAAKDYDGDGKIESGKDEYFGSKDKAIKKAMGKKVKEDTDNYVEAYVTELKKTTLGSYVKKASKNLANRSFDHGESEKRQYDPDEADAKEAKKQSTRQKGIDRAADKLSKEEYDSLDNELLEIVENTLGNFPEGEILDMMESMYHRRNPGKKHPLESGSTTTKRRPVSDAEKKSTDKSDRMYVAMRRVKDRQKGYSKDKSDAADRLHSTYTDRQSKRKAGASSKEAAAQSHGEFGSKGFSIKRGGRGGTRAPETDRGTGNKAARRAGKEVRNTRKESFSDWRDDLSDLIEVAPMTDVEAEKVVKEKKVNNKVTINPKMSEAVAQIGGELIAEKEVDVKDTRRTVDAIRAYDRSKDASRDATYDTMHGKKKKGDIEKKYAAKERGEIKKDDPNWKNKKYHTGMHGEAYMSKASDKKKKKSHDCASKVKHEEFGIGYCIKGQHTILEDGTVGHYDVEFEEYIVENCPVEELEILVSEMHMHKEMKEGVVKKEVKALQKAGKTLKDTPVVKADKIDMPSYKEDKDWIQKAVKRPGAFTRKAKAAGMGVQQFAKSVDANPGKYSTRTKKQANLAQTFASMKKEDVEELFYTLIVE